ncbi:hypothetical protein F4859DRAFT_144649 [Xylaria cf. heliscus]|nr:hypothetical protein F4859DRAFT_144649 [Xylaria cf. heliscus]
MFFYMFLAFVCLFLVSLGRFRLSYAALAPRARLAKPMTSARRLALPLTLPQYKVPYTTTFALKCAVDPSLPHFLPPTKGLVFYLARRFSDEKAEAGEKKPQD